MLMVCFSVAIAGHVGQLCYVAAVDDIVFNSKKSFHVKVVQNGQCLATIV